MGSAFVDTKVSLLYTLLMFKTKSTPPTTPAFMLTFPCERSANRWRLCWLHSSCNNCINKHHHHNRRWYYTHDSSTMIRTLLVLAFCLASASAFVTPVNNAVGTFPNLWIGFEWRDVDATSCIYYDDLSANHRCLRFVFSLVRFFCSHPCLRRAGSTKDEPYGECYGWFVDTSCRPIFQHVGFERARFRWIFLPSLRPSEPSGSYPLPGSSFGRRVNFISKETIIRTETLSGMTRSFYIDGFLVRTWICILRRLLTTRLGECFFEDGTNICIFCDCRI